MSRCCDKRHQMARQEVCICACVHVFNTKFLLCYIRCPDLYCAKKKKKKSCKKLTSSSLKSPSLQRQSILIALHARARRWKPTSRLYFSFTCAPHLYLQHARPGQSASESVQSSFPSLSLRPPEHGCRLKISDLFLNHKASKGQSHPACHTRGENQQTHDIK